MTVKTCHTPWLQPAPAARSDAKEALVIGAGLAGAAIARALAERHWKVTVTERYPYPAGGASGNRQAMLYARLSSAQAPLSRLLLHGYRYSINQLARHHNDLYHPCGLVQLPIKAGEARRQQQLLACEQFHDILTLKSAQELSQLSGIQVTQDGLWFAQAGWIHPAALVTALLQHPGIHFQGGTTVTALSRTRAGWQALTPRGEEWTGSVAVVACGHLANQLQQTKHLPLKRIGGQVSIIPATRESRALRTIVCGKGYIAPALEGYHTLGASFRLQDRWPGCRPRDHEENLLQLRETAPQLAKALELDKLEGHQLAGRTSFRCTTPDYLPVVGPVMDAARFREDFAPLAKNARSVIDKEIPWHQDLYINTGHGSRGLTTCLLAGEILACQISGEAAPAPEDIVASIHPGRFPARALIRGQHTP